MKIGLRVIFVSLLIIVMPLSGCFSNEKKSTPEPSLSPFDFSNEIPPNTFYHFANQTNAVGSEWEANLTGNNTPVWALGTYYGIGESTFEPTIGITSDGTILMTNYRGTGDGTHIIRSQDWGQNWEDVGPFNQVFPETGQVPSSNDPYLYVDKWTDRVVKFDMHALTAMFVEFSDDSGDSWSIPYSAEGYYSPQDHQSIASMPAAGHTSQSDMIYVFCINTGSSALGPQCSRSLNDGRSWDIQRPGYPIGTPQCSGLHGHVVGSNNGNVYRGNPSCDGPAVYKSDDGGYSWSEHTVSTTIGTNSHEVAVATDEADNVYAFWISNDQLPYLSWSLDEGNSWSEPINVAPPGINSTGFPTVFAGDDGRVAVSYIGEGDDGTGWGGYISVITDIYADMPLITSVAVNVADDILDDTNDCGQVRCGGFGDFIDIEIDDFGRPWAALAHNVESEQGIVGTFVTGPSLFGDINSLAELAPGGPESLL
ncbi:MAG: exo-alpha-sialidase [Euryarchaeota archaeon]|nr:exo-alpha-sialidase [Euryarchaeota archaeon]MBT6645760.1 exo-alpha-sialidase [Euryarchaeota archaeon]